MNFLNYSTGEESLCEDGVYYLEEKTEGGGLSILSALPVLKKACNQSPTVRLDAPQGRLQVVFVDSNCCDGEKICSVAAIREKGVGVLE